MRQTIRNLLVLVIVFAATTPAARSEDGEKTGWKLDGSLSYLATSGNTDTSSAGLALDFRRVYEIWMIEAGATAIQARKDGATDAESYAALVRGSRALSERMSLTSGWKGEKDRFAGVNFRSTVDLGVGWKVRTDPKWSVDAVGGVTWTYEDFTTTDDGGNHPGLLLGGRSEVKISENASTTQVIRIEPNLDDSDDYRIDATIGVESSLTDVLAVKLGYDLRYDNQPVPGFEKTDGRVTASIVVKMRRGSFAQ